MNYKDLLESAYESGYEVYKRVIGGLSGDDMVDFIEEANRYGYLSDLTLRGRRFESGNDLGDVVFDDLWYRKFNFHTDDYSFSMFLYEFRGVPVLGGLTRTSTSDGYSEEIELEGFDEDEFALNRVMLYIVDEIREFLV